MVHCDNVVDSILKSSHLQILEVFLWRHLHHNHFWPTLPSPSGQSNKSRRKSLYQSYQKPLCHVTNTACCRALNFTDFHCRPKKILEPFIRLSPISDSHLAGYVDPVKRLQFLSADTLKFDEITPQWRSGSVQRAPRLLLKPGSEWHEPEALGAFAADMEFHPS